MNYFFSNWILRWFVGCDLALLSRCSRSEQKKFFFISLLMFIITLLTGISSFYVAWDIFISTADLKGFSWYLEVILSCSLALFWTLIVFNLFRFLVVIIPKPDENNLIEIGGLFSIIAQIFVALVLTISMGFPLSLFLLKVQIDLQNNFDNFFLLNQVSMTVDYIDKHPQLSTLNSDYDKLQQLKIAEFDLRARAVLYKNNKTFITEIKTALIDNQRQQDAISIEIYDIRSKIESDFTKIKKTEVSMQLIKRARVLWLNNSPITFFILLFLFLIYSSLIFAKALSPRGIYDYLIRYEGRRSILTYGIEEVQLPVPINGKMLTSYRFNAPEFLLKNNVNQLLTKLNLASQKKKQS